ncbi:MAG TPA: sensor histidine kinase [Gemmatimonadales bacterium]|nr:sensor histidine kinase [Gemmatimonadales bacterium]
MDPSPLDAPRLVPWPVGFLIFTLIALAFATSATAMYAIKGDPVPFYQVLYWTTCEWWLWAALAPVIFRLDRRYPLSRERWRRSLPVHLIAYVVVMLVHEVLYVLLERASGWTLQPMPPLGRQILIFVSKRAAFDLLVYSALVGLSCMANIYRRYQERELRASQLEGQLTRAQLEVLRSQLQPHFLFNTLNTISSLIHSDAVQAERVVSRLGDLLRLSLAHDGLHELRLREELEFLGHYVDIQRSRFRERLAVEVDVPPAVLEAAVPTFVLQPLVENAIRHGIEPREGPGRVRVRAERKGDRLVLEVADNGPGLPGHAGPGSNGNGRGIGLTNTRARLAQLYGAAQSITLANGADGGVVVRLEMPWRELPPHE